MDIDVLVPELSRDKDRDQRITTEVFVDVFRRYRESGRVSVTSNFCSDPKASRFKVIDVRHLEIDLGLCNGDLSIHDGSYPVVVVSADVYGENLLPVDRNCTRQRSTEKMTIALRSLEYCFLMLGPFSFHRFRLSEALEPSMRSRFGVRVYSAAF